MHTTYIFGDIEGNITLFESTINTIESHPLSRFIFLGDIYDYKNTEISIQHIQIILTSLGASLLFPFTSLSTVQDVQQRFKRLFMKKQLYCYKTAHPQYLTSVPKEPRSINGKRFIFLFGNKETAFCLDVAYKGTIAKINKHTWSMSVTFEWNVMYTYLMLCHNYYIDGHNNLFIHCYLNYKLFRPLKTHSVVVSGHSKAYGMFRDDEFPETMIYINDLTKLSTSSSINNYMTIRECKFDASYNNWHITPMPNADTTCKLKIFESINE